ncbi:hypothetical protein EDC94DRAFT_654195 [Helicostylum pulchrum]|nr:hypothetical protein EDC94DRAFT_654195 [Helicostylum pulchrum]
MPKITGEQRNQIISLLKSGSTVRKVAKTVGVSLGTVSQFESTVLIEILSYILVLKATDVYGKRTAISKTTVYGKSKGNSKTPVETPGLRVFPKLPCTGVSTGVLETPVETPVDFPYFLFVVTTSDTS